MSTSVPSVHQHTLTLASYHCDRTDHLSLWGLCRIFQEASAYHTDPTPIGYAQLIAQDKAWVLIRMYYEIHTMPSMTDNVIVRTWSRGTDGLIATREFQLLDQQEHPLCSATTHWVIIDTNSRRPVRATDHMAEFPSYAEPATSRTSFSKLRLPDLSNIAPIASITAFDSLIDHTQHVNNAEYIRLIGDHLVPFVPVAPHSSPYNHMAFQIDYLVETQPADTLSLHCLATPEAQHFLITNSKGKSAIASFSPLC
ncbi:MAG: hypothetical protein IJ620_06390 [Bacteroidales bacterium]|nr:hypothetical protein [Bacteroidales bacterium]